MRVSISGKRRELGLGGFPTVSLETAREKAGEVRKAAKDGRELSAARRGGSASHFARLSRRSSPSNN
jgi:hypothetical protein